MFIRKNIIGIRVFSKYDNMALFHFIRNMQYIFMTPIYNKKNHIIRVQTAQLHVGPGHS